MTRFGAILVIVVLELLGFGWRAKAANQHKVQPPVADRTGPESPFFKHDEPLWLDHLSNALIWLHRYILHASHNTEANQWAILRAINNLTFDPLLALNDLYGQVMVLLIDLRPKSPDLTNLQFELFIRALASRGIEVMSSLPINTLAEAISPAPQQWIEQAPAAMRSSAVYRSHPQNCIQYELLLLTVLAQLPGQEPEIRDAKDVYFREVERLARDNHWDPVLFGEALAWARSHNRAQSACDEELHAATR
jgi:hypothetical protein